MLNRIPKGKQQIGTITINVYDGGGVFIQMKGDIPAKCIPIARAQIPYAFNDRLRTLSAANKNNKVEYDRQKELKEVKEKEEAAAVEAEKKKYLLKVEADIVSAKKDLEILKNTSIEGMGDDEKKERGEKMRSLSAIIIKLEKELETNG